MIKRIFAPFCLLITVWLITCPLEAQQPGKVYRVGFLSPRSGIDRQAEAFRQGLAELGFVEGKNTVIEWRFTKGVSGLSPKFADELVRLKVDCILAVGVSLIRAAKEATATIPIVMGTIDADPVEQGLVASLARPGGNITGFTGIAYDTAGKRLEFMKETVPKASHAAMLVAGSEAVVKAHLREAENAARSLKMRIDLLHVQEPKGLEAAFQNARQARADVLTVVGTGLLNSHRPRIVALAANARLPAIYSNVDYVLDGGLMSYTAETLVQFHRAANYVARILNGTNPAELPVQQPTKFEFVVNLKAAKQIALTIPPNVLARADRVIR
jgi:putative tryptophan/tyrosine transport system substrate-binding protein